MALVILTPLLVLIAIVLSQTGEGYVFYRQQRVGRGGERFDLWKFATMLKDSPSMGSGTITIEGDPRILPVGRWLRKSKLNELPQLFNVLSGSMSLVGPRPLTDETYKLYSQHVQESIATVVPGLSGVQQVIVRDEESLIDGEVDSLEFYRTQLAPYKGELELWYVCHQSLKVYFVVIGCTIWNLVAPTYPISWALFQDLPTPPPSLKIKLGFRD